MEASSRSADHPGAGAIIGMSRSERHFPSLPQRLACSSRRRGPGRVVLRSLPRSAMRAAAAATSGAWLRRTLPPPGIRRPTHRGGSLGQRSTPGRAGRASATCWMYRPRSCARTFGTGSKPRELYDAMQQERPGSPPIGMSPAHGEAALQLPTQAPATRADAPASDLRGLRYRASGTGIHDGCPGRPSPCSTPRPG